MQIHGRDATLSLTPVAKNALSYLGSDKDSAQEGHDMLELQAHLRRHQKVLRAWAIEPPEPLTAKGAQINSSIRNEHSKAPTKSPTNLKRSLLVRSRDFTNFGERAHRVLDHVRSRLLTCTCCFWGSLSDSCRGLEWSGADPVVLLVVAAAKKQWLPKLLENTGESPYSCGSYPPTPQSSNEKRRRSIRVPENIGLSPAGLEPLKPSSPLKDLQ